MRVLAPAGVRPNVGWVEFCKFYMSEGNFQAPRFNRARLDKRDFSFLLAALTFRYYCGATLRKSATGALPNRAPSR
jgi:hypothetical protein